MDTVVLFTDGKDTTPAQIVAAWEMLQRMLPWLPSWFKAENVQDVMEYLLDRLAAANLVSVLQIRMYTSSAPDGQSHICHVDVVESIAGDRRVFIGPAGCAGIPNVEAGGGVNFYWKPGKAESEPREMLMTIFY
ncbi:MAG: hypothetical protein C5B53_06920 [Candidatus Melainabacteria bacterium]|nr:MAG: hypothetical protein C5B53_06920 [Candidatus Melainabacteria bacterium]